MWPGSDAELDALLEKLDSEGKLGKNEGYRWIQSRVNTMTAPQMVGEQRVCTALRRLKPDDVKQREAIVKKRMSRRVYVANHYGQADHIDLNCKLTFGHVHLNIYAQARSPAIFTMFRSRIIHVVCMRAPG